MSKVDFWDFLEFQNEATKKDISTHPRIEVVDHWVHDGDSSFDA